jgi:hypothetical protein
LKRNAVEAQEKMSPMQDGALSHMAWGAQYWRKIIFLNFGKGAHTPATVAA